MMLTELAHFDDEGWCIFAEALDVSPDDIGRGRVYKFYTLEFFDGKPRVFITPKRDAGVVPPDKCDLRYMEIEDITTLERGDNIFYFENSKVNYGKVTSINAVTGNAVIDNYKTIKLFTALAYEHNFEEIQGTNAEICKHCKALHTTKKLNTA